MDVDNIFDSAHKSWRQRVKGEALQLCETVEARMETGERPSWTVLTNRLNELGVEASRSTVSIYYRTKYPNLRSDN